MLKSELIRPRLHVHGNRVSPKALPADYHYLTIAADITRLFQQHIGKSRGILADALREYEGASLDYPIIRGLAAVLERAGTFASAPPIEPATLRTALFTRGPVTEQTDLFHPRTRSAVIAEVAAKYGLTPPQVEAALFADLLEEQVLLDTDAEKQGTAPCTPAALIARYNLEVARGLLYWAREVRIEVYDTYKDLFRYIKLFKLMHTVRVIKKQEAKGKNNGLASQHFSVSASQRLSNQPPASSTSCILPPASCLLYPPGYHITLHGPISPFVHSTIRYGLQFAKFMPALLLGEHWQMTADVQPPNIPSRAPLQYILDHTTPLRTHFKSSGAFDSRMEEDFAAEFEAKYGGAKRKWNLAREDELIVTGDTVMIPDFSFTHRQDGRRALLEIVGFWHPNYLRRKVEKVRQAGRSDLILLVYKSANVSAKAFEKASAGEVLMFTRKPILKDVLAAIERCAVVPAEIVSNQ